MKRILIGAAATMSLMVGTVAYAQVTTTPNPPITITSSPMTASTTPGATGAAMGTFTLSGGPSGTISLTSIPLSLTTGSGGAASDLSNCRIINSSGSVLTSSLSSALQSGSNTFVFSPNLSFTGNTSTNYTIRCDVGSAATTSATYSFAVGQPTMLVSGTGTGTTGSGNLMVGYVASPTLTPGIRNVIGVLTLDASRSASPVRISSLPISAAFSGGAGTNSLKNCSLSSVTSILTPLNTGANALTTLGNQSTLTLDTPVTASAGGSSNFVLLCDVDAATPANSAIQLTVTPASVAATNINTGGSIGATGIVASNGTVGTPSGTSVVGTVTATPTPGVPNTGAGGSAPLLTLLLSSLLIATAGAFYILQRKAVR